jgi:hypothetical protein
MRARGYSLGSSAASGPGIHRSVKLLGSLHG